MTALCCHFTRRWVLWRKMRRGEENGGDTSVGLVSTPPPLEEATLEPPTLYPQAGETWSILVPGPVPSGAVSGSKKHKAFANTAKLSREFPRLPSQRKGRNAMCFRSSLESLKSTCARMWWDDASLLKCYLRRHSSSSFLPTHARPKTLGANHSRG